MRKEKVEKRGRTKEDAKIQNLNFMTGQPENEEIKRNTKKEKGMKGGKKGEGRKNEEEKKRGKIKRRKKKKRVNSGGW